ncbi:MAG: ATP-binding protein [Patescibacteria group bacterium]|nr:ATP-binding protein [Patescibacteria group bacterium]
MKEIFFLANPWWENKKFETGILREKYLSVLIKSLNHKRAVLITGSRRVGKTTLLKQFVKYLIEQKLVNSKNILYLSLDHPRISKFSILEIVEEYRKIHLLNRNKKIFLIFDEIQYAKNWEQEIKALVDLENIKIFLSGSANTKIFQKIPFLTGRYQKIKINPLDFKEFLRFKNIKIASTEEYKYEKCLEDYLKIGGYPEYVLGYQEDYFSDLIEGIIFKDIVYLHNIKNSDIIRDLLLLLSDRNGHQTSFTKLSKILGMSIDTIKEYISFLKETYIVNEIERFSDSRSKKIYSAKKFYLHDAGLLRYLASKFNLGSAAETILYNFLSENFKISFYYENQQEIDFAFLNKTKQRILIESKFVNKREEIDDKVILNIKKIAIELNIKKIFIITRNLETIEKSKNVVIKFIPLWKYLLLNKI